MLLMTMVMIKVTSSGTFLASFAMVPGNVLVKFVKFGTGKFAMIEDNRKRSPETLKHLFYTDASLIFLFKVC